MPVLVMARVVVLAVVWATARLGSAAPFTPPPSPKLEPSCELWFDLDMLAKAAAEADTEMRPVSQLDIPLVSNSWDSSDKSISPQCQKPFDRLSFVFTVGFVTPMTFTQRSRSQRRRIPRTAFHSYLRSNRRIASPQSGDGPVATQSRSQGIRRYQKKPRRCLDVLDKNTDSEYPNDCRAIDDDESPNELKTCPDLVCTYCQKSFKNLSMLRTHIRIHTGDKPFICDVCQKSFAQRNNLTVHARIHSGDNPHQCQICRKQFSLLCNLKTHLRLHSGEKPFVCDICNRRFSQRQHLKKHIMTHRGDRSLECRVYRKRFSQKSNLVVHLKTHRETLEPAIPQPTAVDRPGQPGLESCLLQPGSTTDDRMS